MSPYFRIQDRTDEDRGGEGKEERIADTDRLPDLSGYDVCKTLRAAGPLPIRMLTAFQVTALY